MQDIYNNLGVVIGFSILTILVQNFVGEKASQYFVLLTLISMLILNSGNVVDFFKSFK